MRVIVYIFFMCCQRYSYLLLFSFLFLFFNKKKGGGEAIGTESADGSCCVHVVQLHGGDQSGGLVYVVIDRAFHPTENMHVSRLVCGVLMIECIGGGYMGVGGGGYSYIVGLLREKDDHTGQSPQVKVCILNEGLDLWTGFETKRYI